ncbi:MAG: hypothetical protein E7618_01855 [Ruminococcaceae bacterium]|nr:hypothetical protein [Oscillospiraceae bacterium]
MNKRILTVLLVLTMVLAVFAACTTTPTTNNNQTGSVTTGGDPNETGDGETTDLRPEVPTDSMNGFIFSILNYAEGQGYSRSTLDIAEDTEETELVDSQIYKRNRRVEAMYDCTIHVEGVAVPSTTLVQVVSANDDTFDMSMCYEEWIGSCLESITDWQDVPYLNLSAPWWNQGANETFNLGGVQFAATGDFSLSQYSKIHTLVYNKDLYGDLQNAPDLYQLVRDKQWTIDKLYEIDKNFDKNLDGDANVVSDEDGHGLVATSKVIFSLLLTGAGGRLVDVDEDGMPYYALDDGHNLDVLDKLMEINTGANPYYNNVPDYPNGGLNWEQYYSGNTLFYASMLGSVDGTRDLPFSTGYLPAPLFDEDQEQYYSISIGCNVAVVPRTLSTSRMGNVGILLEVLSYESRSTVIEAYRETYLKTKLADENDAEMIQLLFDTVAYDLGNNLWAKEARLNTNKDIFHARNTAYTSLLEVLGTDVENKMSEYLELIEKIVDAKGE